jgi:hypothetical protein
LRAEDGSALVTGGIDEAPPGSKKASGSGHGAKRELSTVAKRPMRSSTGSRENGQKHGPKVGVQDAADVRTSGA